MSTYLRPVFGFILAMSAAYALIACDKSGPAEPPHNPAEDLLTDYPITLAKVTEGVWVHTSNYQIPGAAPIPSNGLIVQDGQELTLIDTAWGEMATASLLAKIKREITLPVTKLVVTSHRHDRLAGVDIIERKGVTIYTHPDTPRLAAAAATPVPNTSVAALKLAKSRTKLGDIELAYPGAGRTVDNLIAYVPRAKLLYAGCALRGAEAKGLGNLQGANLANWPLALRWIKATYPDAEIIVPCRGKGAGLTLIDATLSMLKDESDKREAP